MSVDERAPASKAHHRAKADVEPTQPGQLQPTYVHAPRFAPGSAESVAYLHEHGYAVIAGALSPDECAKALDLTWDYLEGLGTGVDRRDWTTWDDDRWPTAVHGGILPGHGIGHSAAQWFIRGVPAVKQVFAAVWDDDDLLVSFDGMALWRPWALKESWKTNRGGSWLHIDQHPITRPGMQCVQGLVNLLPTSPATGGNVLIPGSHRAFETIPDAYPVRLGRIPLEVDHFRFPADDPLLAGTLIMSTSRPAIICLGFAHDPLQQQRPRTAGGEGRADAGDRPRLHDAAPADAARRAGAAQARRRARHLHHQLDRPLH
jgi:hypothetical protein